MSEPTVNHASLINDIFAAGVAVITGAGSGLGAALAKRAGAAGMHVVAADISTERAEVIAADINAAGGTANSAYVDVTNLDSIKALAALTNSKFGPVRLLINNAGIETLGLTWEITDETWDRVLRINIDGVTRTARAFLPAMVAAGTPASILNIASVAAIGIGTLHAPYFLSKHAVLSFSESLFMELRDNAPHIAVSVALPGPVATRIYQDASVAADVQSVKTGDEMRTLLAAGMSPSDAAEVILSQVAAKNFWCSSHPEMMLAWARQRAAYLNVLANPDACPPLI